VRAGGFRAPLWMLSNSSAMRVSIGIISRSAASFKDPVSTRRLWFLLECRVMRNLLVERETREPAPT
jgi:hypothetical protein